jgi:hypothetical protein
MENNNDFIKLQSNSKQARVKVDLANMPIDHCLRKKNDYYANDRDQIRKVYLQKIRCQSVNHDFSKTQFEKTCHFNPA